jgi:hypothetical protein
MRIRTLLLLVIGIGIGYAIANKLREDDPNVVRGSQSRAGRTVSVQAQKLADQATAKSLDLVKRARGSIRERIGSNGDDAVWN